MRDESAKGNKKLEVVAYGCRGWDIRKEKNKEAGR